MFDVWFDRQASKDVRGKRMVSDAQINALVRDPTTQDLFFTIGLKNVVKKHNVICSRPLSERGIGQSKRLLFIRKMNERARNKNNADV